MQKRILPCSLCAVLLLVIVVRPAWKRGFIDTHDWTLTEFINHLRALGMHFKVVPVNEQGHWGNTVYLSEDPEATWQSFQKKIRNIECIEHWQRAVWIEHLSPEAYTEWDVAAWGSNGCQIGRFVLFGDAQLIERIHKTFRR